MQVAHTPSGVSLRKRTQRACNHCRRRKTKCDGEAGCKSCIDTGLQCSYGNRTKPESSLRYIAHLENKVRALEARLRDLPSRSESAPPVTGGQHDRLQVLRTPNSSQAPDRLVDTLWLDCEHESPGRLFAYRGRTTGIEVLRGLRQLCDAFVNLSVNPDQKAAEMANALDCAAPSSDLPTISPPSPVFLSEAIVRRWIDLAFARSFVLWPFLDRESFNAYVNRTLQAGVLGESGRDDDQLALLHAVLALGQRNDPDLVSLDGMRSHSAETRGLRQFAAARELIPLADCSRSIAAVQTVMCMAMYLMSISAKRAAHTYVSTAGHAAHQLGLHEAATADWLSGKQRAVSQRVYATLRAFDAYITSSLGLPRNLRVIDQTSGPTHAPDVGSPEILTAASANADLLEIMSNTREIIFFTDVTIPGKSSNIIDSVRLHELNNALDMWASTHVARSRRSQDGSSDRTETDLFLRFTHCYVLLVLYSPLLHHILKPMEHRSSSADMAASRCVEGAIDAVCIAETMRDQKILYEAYPLTIDVLVMAATTLLVVELGAPDDMLAVRAKGSSRKAKELLETLASKNSSASRCLGALTPLYQVTDGFAEALVPSANQRLESPILPQRFNSEVQGWKLLEGNTTESFSLFPTDAGAVSKDPFASSLWETQYSMI
ncbi:hypothetical protein WHR41_09427 [Cladosporium halotolerans]|uniref:Zn(2)-C6 fungal-type domain-containing protein n=1 Tax=Cladosporium halotolerans TaxID=1052096 RepID=A0AB34KDC0_9PEZI